MKTVGNDLIKGGNKNVERTLRGNKKGIFHGHGTENILSVGRLFCSGVVFRKSGRRFFCPALRLWTASVSRRTNPFRIWRMKQNG